MAGCVFCGIVSGDIPSLKLFEDEHSCAFFDINPISPGHALVIPTDHCASLLDAPSAVAQGVFETVHRLAGPLVEASEADGLNVLANSGRCAGQLVEHFHVHLIPRKVDDGLGWSWHPKSADPDYLSALAEKVKARISP